MTDAAIDGAVVRARPTKRLGWWARLREGFAAWLAREEPEADPTASLSTREWADLPVYHPPGDE